MKKRVLIVEDDKFFRFAVKKVIRWEDYGFEITGEAVHGAAALEFLKEHPAEMVLTDMSMPVMNGIELTAALKKNYPDLLIVALSAYDDFEFVKESLKLGAQDYILKQDIEKENIGETLEKLWKNHMRNLLADKQLYNGILQFLRGFEADGRVERYLELCMERPWGCVLCRTENISACWKSPECRNPVWTERALLELHDETEHILLLPIQNKHSMKQQSEDLSRQLLELEHLLLLEDYLAGCSLPVKDVRELPERYREALQSSEIGRFSAKKKIRLWEYEKERYEKREEHFLAEKARYLQIRTPDEAERFLTELTSELCRKIPSEEAVLKNYLLLVNTISQNLHAELDKLGFVKLKEELERAKLLSDKQEVCTQYLEHFFSEYEKKEMHPAVRKGIHYMLEHYKQELSLGEIAEYTALNEGYFSGIFKKETGKSVTEYLNKIRIDQAKELIAQTNLKNYEIAEQVGIHNSSYFSTIFKKQAGMTIQEYRQVVSRQKPEI